MTNDVGTESVSSSSGYPFSALHINTVVSPLLACGGQARGGGNGLARTHSLGPCIVAVKLGQYVGSWLGFPNFFSPSAT